MIVVPDALNDIRAWLRQHPDLSPLHNGRVFFRIPDNQTQFPLLRIYRSGGGIVAAGGDAPVQNVNVSIECWHNTGRGYQALRQLVNAVESALWQLGASTLINPAGNTVVLDALVTNVIDSPDPDEGWPRFVVDSRFTVTAPITVHQ